MGRLSLPVGILLTLLIALCSPIHGSNPTYRDCKPLIDATIYDLAAKAIHAGEQPDEPRTDQPCPAAASQTPVEESSQVVTPPAEEAPPRPPPPQAKAPEYVPPPPPPTPREPKSQPVYQETDRVTVTPKQKIGIFDSFINSVFGLKGEYVRESKWAVPWNTHPEFKKKKVEKTSTETTKVDSTPGFIRSSINELVYKIFGNKPASGEREAKWAEPWQTHKEHIRVKVRKEEPTEHAKVDSTPGFIRSSINELVYKIFGNKPASEEREAKWAEPWQTHKEHIRVKVKKEEPTEHAKVDSTPGYIRSSINELVYKIFGNKPASEEREAKWAEPWQTHKEHLRVKVKKEEPTEHAKVDSTPGFIRSSINELVYKIFGNKPTSEERDAKWAEPWQTHKEHLRVKVKKEEPTEHAKVDSTPGFIRSSINELVYKIFGNKPSSEEREHKWAQPWQTHKEHVKAPKLAPVPAVPPPVVHTPPTPQHAHVTPSQPVTVTKESVSPAPHVPPSSYPSPAAPVKAEEILPKTTTPPPQETFPSATQANKDRKQPSKGKEAQKTEVVKTTRKKSEKSVQKPKKEINKKSGKKTMKKPEKETMKKTEKEGKDEKQKSKPEKLPPKMEEQKAKSIGKEKREHEKAQKVAKKTLEVATKHSKVSEDSERRAERARVKKEKSIPEKPNAKPNGPKTDKKPTSPPVERVVDAPKAPVKQVLEEVAAHQAEVQREAAFEENDQIVVVPSAFRSRDHIDSILGLDEASIHASARTGPIAEATLRDLKKVYETAIKPLEATFKYQDISNRHLSDAELFGTPLMLMLGPYSTGKSTFVNYLLGVEFTKRALKTGTPPSHGVFRIIQYGEHDRDLDGTDLTGHWSFGSLQKFGQNFVDQVRGKALNIPLLKKVTFVEAPGILEMRRPGERLYPFNDAVQWFIDRADLILVMFDYTKLDAGYEMEAILDQLKGREAQTRILLNKADQVPPEELMKVQGSLFWNLSPILGVAAPPNVYAGSFTSLPYRPSSPVKLFQVQEEALLRDVAMAINARVDNRIAITRRHAVRVSNHAQMVDTYLKVFYTNKGFLTSKHKLAEEIIENPHAYNIYEGMSLLTNISRYDLPDAEVYRDFFRIHNLYDFRTLRETCTFIGGCPLEKIDAAINKQLPELMERHRRLVGAASPETRLPDPSLRSSRMGAGTAHVHSTKL